MGYEGKVARVAQLAKPATVALLVGALLFIPATLVFQASLFAILPFFKSSCSLNTLTSLLPLPPLLFVICMRTG